MSTDTTHLIATQEVSDDNSEKNAYFSSDSTNEEYLRIMQLDQLLGIQSSLSDKSDGTVIGALRELYSKLGKYNFSVNIDNKSVEVSEVTTSNNEINLNNDTSETDLEKIKHLESLVGNKDDLKNLNQKTIVNAILDLYSRMSGLSFTSKTDISSDDDSNNEKE